MAPALVNIVRTSDNLLERFHALWVLEGIGGLQTELVKDMMKDPNPRMRIQGMWASESLYKSGDKTLAQNYLGLMNDPENDVKIRAMMTCRLLKIPGTNAAVKKLLAANHSKGVQLVGEQVITPIEVTSFFGRSNPNLNDEQKALVAKGAEIYSGLCSTCHGPLGTGLPFGENQLMAPSLVASARIQAHSDYVVKVLLRGMTGDIEGKHYAGVMMAPMGQNTDEWIASVASFVRTNFENESGAVSREDVARVRKETAGQTKPYTFDALWSSVPKQLTPSPDWKVTASHTGEVRKGGTVSPAAALTFEGWTTGVTQKEGMWFQIEFPSVVTVSEMHFKSPPISRGWWKDAPPPIHTSPSDFRVEVSEDGKSWRTMIANGVGTGQNNLIRFDPVKTRFVRITLNKSLEVVHGERRGKPFDFEVVWNMREMKVYGGQ